MKSRRDRPLAAAVGTNATWACPSGSRACALRESVPLEAVVQKRGNHRGKSGGVCATGCGLDRRALRTAGFTLLEMMIAIGILMLVTAIGWGPAMRMSREHRVKAATEDVRQAISGTRYLALDQDVVFQFRYEPNGRRYCRVPYEAPTESQSAGQVSAVSGRLSGELPLGMSFETVSGEPVGGPLTPEILGDLPSDYASVGWSGPVLFFSDGSASDASFEIVDEQASSRRLSVRNLTGAVTVKLVE